MNIIEKEKAPMDGNQGAFDKTNNGKSGEATLIEHIYSNTPPEIKETPEIKEEDLKVSEDTRTDEELLTELAKPGTETPLPPGAYAEMAMDYWWMGFIPLPVRTGEKCPFFIKWPEIKGTKKNIEQWVKTNGDNEICDRLDNFVSIDIDNEKGMEEAKRAGLPMNTVIIESPGKTRDNPKSTYGHSYRIYYRLPKGTICVPKKGKNIEIRSGAGFQDMLPESKHPDHLNDGQLYRFREGHSGFEIEPLMYQGVVVEAIDKLRKNMEPVSGSGVAGGTGILNKAYGKQPWKIEGMKAYLAKYKLHVWKHIEEWNEWPGTEVWMLEHCVNEDRHTNASAKTDAIIGIVKATGIPFYGCFHSSCITSFEDKIKAISGNDSIQEYLVERKDIGGIVKKASDIELAEVFAKQFKDTARYNKQRDCWMLWNGKVWEEDMGEGILKYGMETARAVKNVLEERLMKIPEDDDDKEKMAEYKKQRTPLGKKIANLETEKAQRTPYRLAKPDLHIDDEMFDTHPTLLNVQNGMVDMETGKLYDPDPKKMLTIMAPIDFDPNAKCPFWESHMMRIFDNDKDMVSFMKRALGYTISGLVDQKKAFLCWGIKGNNGKTVTFESLKKIFGKYTGTLNAQALMLQKWNDTRRNEIMVLKAKRLVTVGEIGKEDRLNVSTLKDLTGGDTISGREHNINTHDFNVHFKLWLRCNYKPEITDQDNAIWNRIYVIPFDVSIFQSEADWLPDYEFYRRVWEERSGILNWHLGGFVDFLKMGGRASLCPPEKVILASEAYRKDSDELNEFVEVYCDTGAGLEDTGGRLFTGYQHYAEYKGIEKQKKLTRNTFPLALEVRGYKKERRKRRDAQYFLGIRIKDNIWDGIRSGTMRNYINE